jgi:hypothetical protein
MWEFVEIYVWSNDSTVCVSSCCPNVSVTQWHNCQMWIQTAWSSKQMHIQKYISFPDWALQSRQQHHLLCRNGAAKSSDSLAIKILPRRINCNSLFIAYHLSACLWEHQLGHFDIQRIVHHDIFLWWKERDALFLKFIWRSTLRVSDRSAVHHQEYLNTVYTAIHTASASRRQQK